jgi:putative SOS response-associated peptidase YedK
MMRWGISSGGRGDEKIEFFNARAESLLEKRSFKRLVPDMRAALLTDGYFEWRESDGVKIPYYIQLSGGRLMLLAALWSSEGGNSFTVITREPLPEIKFIHPRMPAVIDGENLETWLDVGNVGAEAAVAKLASFSGELSCQTVSRTVNSTRNNSPECIRPVDYPEQPSLFSE